jgi:hypothetical protein
MALTIKIKSMEDGIMKNKNGVTFVLICLGWFIFSIGFMAGISSQPTKTENVVKENKIVATETNKMSNETAKPIETKMPEKTFEPKEYTFGNGNFTVGKDFDKGTYNIIAVSGGGNVHCTGDINAIMGTKGDGSFYEREYKNIRFEDGNVLEITNVTIKLIKQDR